MPATTPMEGRVGVWTEPAACTAEPAALAPEEDLSSAQALPARGRRAREAHQWSLGSPRAPILEAEAQEALAEGALSTSPLAGPHD